MKKTFIFVLIMTLLPLASVSGYADPIRVPLQIMIVDPNAPQNNPNRNPIFVPEVSLDGYTLYFNTPCDSCTLRIIDEGGIVAYSTVIPVGCDELVLPSYLSGEYEIQIDFGPYYVVGRIELEEEE